MPAKVDYATRALVALARAMPEPVKGDQLAREEAIPFRFLEATLGDLRRVGLVESRRGSDGGYWLARAAADISMADVMVAVEGALVDLRMVPVAGERSPSQEVWQRAADHLHQLLAGVSLADLLDQTRQSDQTDQTDQIK